jgi:DNA-binding response OmpR family regulator
MRKILVIDDEKPCVALLHWHLNRNGYGVLTATNGDEALELLGRESVDLVITDIIMPGKDGLETILEIRKRWPDLKIIAISGGGMCGASLYTNLSLKLGAAEVLNKPFTSAELLRAVTAQLPGAPGAGNAGGGLTLDSEAPTSNIQAPENL